MAFFINQKKNPPYTKNKIKINDPLISEKKSSYWHTLHLIF